jgi:hypothetical protein
MVDRRIVFFGASKMTAADDALVSRLQEIIDSDSRAVSEKYFEWIESTLSDTDWDAFELALERGDFSRAADLVHWDEFDIQDEITATMNAASEAEADYIGKVTRGGFRYDLKNPNALKWIEDHGAELVTQIDEPTRRAIREVVHRGYFSGRTVRDQAEVIRGLVGLTPGETERLEKMAADLEGQGLSMSEVDRIIGEEAEASRKRRAGIIATNETSEAANRGQFYTTKDAVGRGIIDPTKYEAYRIVTPDERLCDVCAANAGEARPLPDGVYPSTGDTIAKMHTVCRCCEGIRLISRSQKGEKGGRMIRTPGTREAVGAAINVVFEAKKIKETDESIFVPTVPVVEGITEVYGFPALRLFDEFYQDSKWLEGLAVVSNHEEITPDARRIGQLRNPKPNPSKKRVEATTEFYKIDLTQRELEEIREGKPMDGSLRFMCYLEFTAGEWNGQPYEAIERGPYVFIEYSKVRHGMITPEAGAGFFVESNSQSPARRAEKGDSTMGDPNDPGHEPGITEATIASQIKTAVSEAETRMETKYQARIDELEKEKKAREVMEFSQNHLKPGFEDKAAELYEQLKADPIAFVREHKDKLVFKKEGEQLRGNPSPGNAPGEFSESAHQQRMKSIYEEA